MYNYKIVKPWQITHSPDNEENVNVENGLQNWLKDEIFQLGENEREIVDCVQRIVVDVKQGHPKTHNSPHSSDNRNEAL